MTTAIFSDGRPMAEAEFLAIGETPERIELFDGSLHVTPAATPLHQLVSRRLANTMDAGAEAAGLLVLEAVNVRINPSRIPIPDLVISSVINLEELVIDASAIRLVCEIISPSNASTDRVLKMHYYAAGRIPWYLLVDPSARTLQLFRLVGDTYVEEFVAKDGDVLHLSKPVVATIDLAELLPRV
ncbi:Uma2 family endonuclease [Paractinoplanes durhamensis]|nr:Uma2 family endonuclease [Actinoplanes durhamensis]